MTIRKVGVAPYADGRRVKFEIDLVPSDPPPNLGILVRDCRGRPVAETFVVETPDEHLELTLHLRGGSSFGPHTAILTLGFKDEEPLDQTEEVFEMPSQPQAVG